MTDACLSRHLADGIATLTLNRPQARNALNNALLTQIAEALEVGQPRRGSWQGHEQLAMQLLSDDPQANISALLDALRQGASEQRM